MNPGLSGMQALLLLLKSKATICFDGYLLWNWKIFRTLTDIQFYHIIFKVNNISYKAFCFRVINNWMTDENEIAYELYRRCCLLRSRIISIEVPKEFRNVEQSDKIFDFDYLKNWKKCEEEIDPKRDIVLRQRCLPMIQNIQETLQISFFSCIYYYYYYYLNKLKVFE